MTQQIHFGEPYTLPLPREKHPFAQHLAVRYSTPEYGQQTFQLYVVKDVLEQVKRHVKENLRVECGGILVGHPFQNLDDPDMTFVVITAAIVQDSRSHSIAHFTVGPKEIEVTRDKMQKMHPGWVCVGWYHSHPGHGVFLSGQDMQIVRSIYNAEWHLALVIDPQSDETAFFRGPEGERLPNWIELHAIPETVKAIALYNQAIEAQQNDNLHEFERLKQSLSNIPELSHWHSLGKYQDLELESRLLQKQAYVADRLALEVDDSPADSMEHDTLENQELSHPDSEQITKNFSQAEGYYKSGSIVSALNMFRTIPKTYHRYKEVDSWIKRIEQEEKANRYRQNTKDYPDLPFPSSKSQKNPSDKE